MFKNRKKVRTARCGFTLLEILISLAVMSILLAVLYRAYTSNVEAIQLSRGTGRLDQVSRIVLERMSKDLESAFIRAPYANISASLGMRLVDQRIGDRPADRLDFTAMTHLSFFGNAGGGDFCEVGYYLEEDPAGNGMVLYRRDDGSPDADFTKGGHREELTRMVTGFDIVFEDEKGLEYAVWRAENDGMLPARVRLRLQLADDNGGEQVFSTSVHPALINRKKQ